MAANSIKDDCHRYEQSHAKYNNYRFDYANLCCVVVASAIRNKHAYSNIRSAFDRIYGGSAVHIGDLLKDTSFYASYSFSFTPSLLLNLMLWSIS